MAGGRVTRKRKRSEPPTTVRVVWRMMKQAMATATSAGARYRNVHNLCWWLFESVTVEHLTINEAFTGRLQCANLTTLFHRSPS